MSDSDLPETLPPKGETRVGKLDSIRDVRAELGRLYRTARRNCGEDISPTDASKLAHILSTIGRQLEASELEDRIAALEERLREGNGR